MSEAVSTRIPVAWGEMDAFQHVNNVVYARWIETGRIAYFERIGFMDLMRDEGVGPILARLVVDYRRPVTYPDTVRMDVSTSRVGNTSFTMGFSIWSEAQGAEVASGEQVIVVFDYRAGRPVPLPARLRAGIAAAEAPTGGGESPL
jgi:acyl-CoA thioester hydrolase